MCDCNKKQKKDKKSCRGKGRRARVVETTVCTYNNACSPYNQCNQLFSACGCGNRGCGGCDWDRFDNCNVGCGGCGDRGCGGNCGYRRRCETNWVCGCGVASCGGACGWVDPWVGGACGCGVSSCRGGCGWNRWNDCGSRIYWNQSVTSSALGCNTGCYGGGLYTGLYGGAACGVGVCGRRY